MDIIRGYISEMTSRFVIPRINFTDAIEILALAFAIYYIAKWIRNTRAWMLLKGILVILVLILIAAILQLNVILWIFGKALGAGITLLLIVFQPELRVALEQLGQKKIVNSFSLFDDGKVKNDRFTNNTIEHIITATYDLARTKTGALIVVEKDVVLGECERTGIALDSKISSQLLVNIFEHNTPLHDGAVLVRGDRLVAATCYLPLSDNQNLSKELGTRHRAGVGVSEISDSLTIIVSEETGKVSIAKGGKITRNITVENLRKRLRNMQNNTAEIKRVKSLKGWHRNERKND
ncbi:MAG: TIGR00159 family protein [Lachnospiraceae bacterium]|nr:TIGR00159 family protein [Lachnospiraceae bacterium]